MELPTLLLLVLHTACLSVMVGGDSVPVLIWSPERSMSNLPDVSTDGIVEADSFKGTYLSPLMRKPEHSAVVFLQDKLHMDDFTKYADVYSVDSTGGSFKNVKNLMDENFSLELSHVAGASAAVSELQHQFEGAVHTIDSLHDLEGLQLGEKFLLLVRLAPTSGSLQEEKILAGNDEMIGAVCDHLKQKGVKYTAVYTGERDTSAPAADDGEAHSIQKRHLLADASQENINGTLMNITAPGVSPMFIYMKTMKVVVQKSGKIVNKFDIIPTTTSADKSTLHNKSAEVVLNFPGQTDNITSGLFDISVIMSVANEGDRWVVSDMKLHVEPKGSVANQTDITNGTLANGDLDLKVPILYSFHCTWMNLYLQTVGITNADYKDYKGTYVKMTGFQFQPFMVQKNRFFDSVDCVGFFTLGIWMGLVPVALLLSILLGGTIMLLSLSIMDKYDDPKGKTISVAVGND